MKKIELRGQQVAVHELIPFQSTENAPWILIHGAGHDGGVWDEISGPLAAAGEHVIVPDLPGHGGSAGEPLADIADMAAWVLELADALGHRQLNLCGHSMGSLVALAATSAAVERVRHLVLVGNTVPMPVSPFLLESAQKDLDRAHALINKFSFAPATVLGEARRNQLQVANLQRMQRQSPPALANDLAACNAWQDGLDAAARVRCPTLVVNAELDQMTPVDRVIPLLDVLEKGHGGTRMIVLPGTGHSMMQEAPEAVVEALLGAIANRQ